MDDIKRDKKQLSIKVDEDIFVKLWEIAHKRETPNKKVTINEIVNEALVRYTEEVG